jgi:hypothetical protein
MKTSNPTAWHSQTKPLTAAHYDNRPSNHEDLASIIKQAIDDEHYHDKLMNNGATKVNVPNDYDYRILTISLKANYIRWSCYENKRN